MEHQDHSYIKTLWEGLTWSPDTETTTVGPHTEPIYTHRITDSALMKGPGKFDSHSDYHRHTHPYVSWYQHKYREFVREGLARSFHKATSTARPAGVISI